MTLIPYLDPLSHESLEIVVDKGNLDNVDINDTNLINIVQQTPNQTIDTDCIPTTLYQLALKRINWYIERTNNKDFNKKDYSYLFNTEIIEYDVLTFHMLAQAIATKFNITSRETKLFIDSQKQLILDRLNRLIQSEKEEIIELLIQQFDMDINAKWVNLKDILSPRKLPITELFINKGEIILELEDFIEVYGDNFKDRRPQTMYEMLIGEKQKEEILSYIIINNIEKYIENIKEKSSIIDMHENIIKLGDALEKLINEEMSRYSTFYANKDSYTIGKLIKEAFPPCIAETVNGVSSGGRNDAIVLLLTSFTSYARLYPGIFGSDGTVKVSDIDKDLKITENEILPLIYEAAENCTPPLFEDQPQEKLNIISKLGFGLHEDIRLENEGETTWYAPMSCDKIKMHLPQLCHPDKDCTKVNNPLSCYGIKRNRIIREGKGGED